MPVYEHSSYGDLFVEYNVILPVSLSNDAKRSELDIFCSYALADIRKQKSPKHLRLWNIVKMNYRAGV
jgi:hypothetical protein